MKKILVFALFAFFAIIACTPANNEGNTDSENTAQTLSEASPYMNKGKQVVSVLSSTILSRLNYIMNQSQSIQTSVKYCKLIAYDLVDTTGQELAQSARRVSLKVRNLKDEPTDLERDVLNEYKSKQLNGDTLLPVTREIDANTIGYFHPIKMQEMCLKCHGIVGEDISAEDYAYIEELYPNDRAIGYREGEIRGMWSIYLTK